MSRLRGLRSVALAALVVVSTLSLPVVSPADAHITPNVKARVSLGSAYYSDGHQYATGKLRVTNRTGKRLNVTTCIVVAEWWLRGVPEWRARDSQALSLRLPGRYTVDRNYKLSIADPGNDYDFAGVWVSHCHATT